LLPGLTNVAPGQIIAFRYVGGWQQVPVQIDERKWVDFGRVYNSSNTGLGTLAYADTNTFSGGDTDPMFVAADKLVFMAKDAGNRVPPATYLPSGVLTNNPIELTVTDPLNGGTGYIYLFRTGGGLSPGAGTNYVNYTFNLLAGNYLTNYGTINGPNPEDSAAVTPYYREHFSDRWIHDETKVFTAGSDGIDILYRHQNLFAPGNCLRSENTFSAGEGAFFANKSGPVRAIRSYIGANSGVQDTLTVGPISWEMVTGSHGTLIFSHTIDTDISNLNYRSYYSDTLTPSPLPCTGDSFQFGCSGLWITNNIPNTDPSLGSYNALNVTRVI